MATIAAVAVFYSYRAQREDAELQYFERNFFTLLGNFRAIVNEIDVTRRKKNKQPGIPDILRFAYGEIEAEHHGREALRIILLIIRSNMDPGFYNDSKSVYRVYIKQHDKFSDDLAHYFRSLYHIYKFIDEKCPRNRKHYSRILRAHLSNSELCLIAYNCICGEGRFEFVNYIEKYSVLHNIQRQNLSEIERSELNFFTRILPEGSFRFDPIEPFKY